MKRTYHLTRKVGWLLSGALILALTGCTTYVERPVQRTVYVPEPAPPAYAPTEAPVVVIQTASDFYEPLSPYGVWVDVPGYGRCWRPAGVAATWRPYASGHWEPTDAGWYWASDEPWGWATYHYGRWHLSAQFGWVWLPQTQWAPAWVSWRAGAGYVGWAPLPPSARFASSGVMEVQGPPIAPQEFVFVPERNLLAPVAPQTVIINNTTIINQTIHLTSVKMVNRAVFNEGPRAAEVERFSGRKLQTVPVRDLRHREETEAVARRHNAPPASQHYVETPPRQPTAPSQPTPQRELRPPENPRPVIPQPPPTAPRNENRVTVQPNSPVQYTAPQPARPLRPAPNEPVRAAEPRRPAPVATPAPVRPQPARQEITPARIPVRETPRRVTAPAPKQTEVHPQPQRPAVRTQAEPTRRILRPLPMKKGAQVQVERASKLLPKKSAASQRPKTKPAAGAERRENNRPNPPANRSAGPQSQRR